MIKQLSLFLYCLIIAAFSQAQVTVQWLRCEMLENPQGIDIIQPRLSWQLESSERDVRQTAYQIIVSSTAEKLSANDGDLWNSGKVVSDVSLYITYAGQELSSRTRCYWKVKVWTNKGETEWSLPSDWSMGLLQKGDWAGQWIGLNQFYPGENASLHSRLAARYFRKEFTINNKVTKATAYIIGLGLYELYINGEKKRNAVLAPVPTDFTKNVKYNVFDITAQLQTGRNAVGVVLGNGRYFSMRQGEKGNKQKHYGFPKLLLQIELKYENGLTEKIITDESWKATAGGPIISNNEYDGEIYDARKELSGWDMPHFQDTAWSKAERVEEPGGKYEAQLNPNMKVMDTVRPLTIHKRDINRYILDLGQNMAGWLKLKARGKRGDILTLRFAETLQPNGELYRENLRDALATDLYIFKGAATPEEWHPAFVYHGFRYVEITGLQYLPLVTDFEGHVVYDEMETSGSFQTSDTIINGIYKNAYWGIRSNYKGMPVDCPQRNERHPWLGDRSTGSYGESFIFNNQHLYSKWLDDIAYAQKPTGSLPDIAPAYWRFYTDNITWPGTYLMVANMLHRQYGDDAPIKKHYASMKKWMQYMQAHYMQGYILMKDEYGDWCVPPEKPSFIHARNPTLITDGVLIATATYYHFLSLMQKFAVIAGQPDDITAYTKLAEKIRSAFNKEFFRKKKGQYSNNSITANLLPLYYGIVESKQQEKVFQQIVNKTLQNNKAHIGTGVIGTQYIVRGLTENGRPDIAYQLATSTTYPGWGYMLKNGATTIWELWNGNTANPSMNSGNHVMLLGDLVIWYYENLGGIKSSEIYPGFKQLVIKPSFLPQLSYVNASYESVYGTIKSHWQRSSNNFRWEISIPPNTSALIYLPASSENNVLESGLPAIHREGIHFTKMEDGKAVFSIGSGNYVFQVAENGSISSLPVE